MFDTSITPQKYAMVEHNVFKVQNYLESINLSLESLRKRVQKALRPLSPHLRKNKGSPSASPDRSASSPHRPRTERKRVKKEEEDQRTILERIVPGVMAVTLKK